MYTPVAAAAEPPPCIVYFHGGAWIFGDLDTHNGMCRMLANESDCRVVSIEYRLAPEHKFPAALEDAYAATEWVAFHASKLGIYPGRICLPPAQIHTAGFDRSATRLKLMALRLKARALRCAIPATST